MCIGNLIRLIIMFLGFLAPIQVILIVHILRHIGVMIVLSHGQQLSIIAIRLHLIQGPMFLSLGIIIGRIQKLKLIKFGRLSRIMDSLRLI